jgi:hypothetical protein
MHFDTKSYLKSTRNHTAKHAYCSILLSFYNGYPIFCVLFAALLNVYNNETTIG